MLYQGVLDEIVSQSKEILKSKLTGIYLHGSMAMGCFNPDKSDIDLIIVIEDDISDEQKMMLMRHIVSLNRQAPAKGLEISVVKRECCNPFVYPTPFVLHFSPVHLQWFKDDPHDYIAQMKGEDVDLAAHFTVIRKYGIVLWGERKENVFAPVPRRDYMDSICSDIQNAAEDILKQPVYVTFNLCRVLAFARDGLCLSKKEGGKWGMEHLSSECHAVIAKALECYTSDKAMAIEQKDADAFVKKAMRLIEEENCHG